jgi:tetratricopeptide (TPR) repeat protein
MHFNLGRALEALGDAPAAVESYCEALRQDPNYNPARVRLAALDPTAASRLDQGMPKAAVFEEEPNPLQNPSSEAAFEAFAEALTRDPGQSKLHSKLLANLHYLPATDPLRIFQAHQSWGRALSRHLGCEAPAPVQRPVLDRPLRVGYVSPDLRRHSVAFFLEPLLAHHDPAVVEVHAYSDVPIGDEVTLRLRSLVPHWHPSQALDDEALEPGPLPMLVQRQVTFGSFNNLIKLNPESLLPWAAILRALPGSRLLLKDS